MRYIEITLFFFLLATNTQSIFENLFDEDILNSSDCDNVDKDPNYTPFINLETTMDPLCTADGMYTFSKLIEVTINDMIVISSLYSHS